MLRCTPFLLALFLLAHNGAAQTGSVTNEDAKLRALDSAAGAFFGNSVAIEGNLAAIGAPVQPTSGQDFSGGAAYVFEYEQGGGWTQVAKLTASDADSFDLFGSSVAISGGHILVGAFGDDDLGSNSGSAYVFEVGTWTEVAKLTASDGQAFDRFGVAATIAGNRAIVGAWGDTGSNPPGVPANPGAVYVFERIGATWMETAKVLPTDGLPYESFGVDVDVSGDRLAIGSGRNSDSGRYSGAVYVFELSGGSWMQAAKLEPSDAGPGKLYGRGVALSGDLLLVGAPADDENGFRSGAAYALEYTNGSWVQKAKLLASDGAENDLFGSDVDLSGSRAVIGAHEADGSSGKAYGFDQTYGEWRQYAILRASDAAADDLFGNPVAISGNLSILGASRDDGSGSAYAFDLARPLALYLQNSAAYRTLAHPAGGTVGDLLGFTQTQGFPESDLPGSGFCSVYTYDETAGSFSGGYECVAAESQPVDRGTGVFAYVFEDDDPAESGMQGGFPKLNLLGGTVPDPPFSGFPITYTASTPAPAYQNGWNLLGNPFNDGLDWDLAVRSGGLTDAVYVYDPDYFGGDYRTWSAGLGGDLADGVIPAFQGFFAKAVSEPVGLEIRAGALVDDPGLIGKTAPAPLRLALSDASGDEVSAAFVAVSPEAALGVDALDAVRLTPGAWPRAVLSTSSLGVDPAPLALNALPPAEGEVVLPLAVAAEGHAAGPLMLSLAWTGALPEGWAAALLDRETGARVPLTPEASYAFTLDVPASGDAAKARPAALGLDLAPPAPRAAEKAASGGAASSGDRFALVLTPPAVVSAEGQAPEGLALGPVAPNPASGAATIAVAAPEAGPVEVSVYDALGRRVAHAREGRPAGTHRVAVPVAGLAPGAYVVRVETASDAASQRFTIAR